MVISILSFLLHHANRHTKATNFYNIKSHLLKKYGDLIGYDVQHIPGIRCNSCDGKGRHPRYGNNGKIYDYADCYHCSCGWYRLPTWVVLARYSFGKFIFHQPERKEYSTKKIQHINPIAQINGYIEHEYSKWGSDSLMILYIIFDFKRWFKEWRKSIGKGYYIRWNTPYKFLNNFIHILRNKKSAMCFQKRKNIYRDMKVSYAEDLPF